MGFFGAIVQPYFQLERFIIYPSGTFILRNFIIRLSTKLYSHRYCQRISLCAPNHSLVSHTSVPSPNPNAHFPKTSPEWLYRLMHSGCVEVSVSTGWLTHRQNLFKFITSAVEAVVSPKWKTIVTPLHCMKLFSAFILLANKRGKWFFPSPRISKRFFFFTVDISTPATVKSVKQHDMVYQSCHVLPFPGAQSFIWITQRSVP